ncbi:ROK family protein [Carboxydochorda subterranea]|uniref:ROK family protein n=1 Tax=Carboxydichorda subterranea TaxID=3109565 RepID=A0ABZ1BXV5_9FIRM|nr:ROK family protein [Limnochorda sp. L945t]WRP17584.1 ROK family protein [Limnochorda sp. L945t]
MKQMGEGRLLAWAVGIDIGGTKIAGGLVCSDGRILHLNRRPSRAGEGPGAVAATAVEVAKGLVACATAEGLRPVALGIGTGGQVDTVKQQIVGSTAVIPGLAGYPLREQLQEETGLPTFLDNDAKVVARAEALWGAAQGVRDAIIVTLGTGIGGAVIVNGDVIDGARGLAGHLGHIVVQPDGPTCSCGGRGCLEALASATAILRAAREKAANDLTLGARVVDATAVFRLGAQGVSWANALLDRAANAIGLGLAGLVHTFDPELIVVGGGLAAWGEPWRERLAAAIRARVMESFRGHFEVRLARFGPDAGVAGAGALALARVGSGGW